VRGKQSRALYDPRRGGGGFKKKNPEKNGTASETEGAEENGRTPLEKRVTALIRKRGAKRQKRAGKNHEESGKRQGGVARLHPRGGWEIARKGTE